MGTSPMCLGFMTKGELCTVQSRANCGTLQRWSKHLAWRVEPEVVWCSHGSVKSRLKFSTLRLVVAASSIQDPKQNVDLPTVFPKKKKRPPLMPKQTRKRRLPDIFEDPTLKPPGNGLLVPYLIPVAHEVMEAKAILNKGVRLLLEEFPIVACRFCTEAHVGPVGHNLRTCRGPKSSTRNSLHDWVKGTMDDILLPIDAYHLADRLAKPVSHDDRFDVVRIPAIDELCIQAGLEAPEYPTKRYTEPVEAKTRKKRQDAGWLGGVQFTFYTEQGSYLYREPPKRLPRKPKNWVDVDNVGDTQSYDSEEFQIASTDPSTDEQHNDRNRLESDDARDTDMDNVSNLQTYETEAMDTHLPIRRTGRFNRKLREPLVDIQSEDDPGTIAQKTLQAWEKMREGCQKLMVRYRVMACGYCPEIHVGPRGHGSRNCGEYKHQWRDGRHGWQDASLDDLIPPQYVWHVRDRLGPPLENSLKRYYGKAPALVELCVQAGAPIPESHAPLMRLDVAIPTVDEMENVV